MVVTELTTSPMPSIHRSAFRVATGSIRRGRSSSFRITWYPSLRSAAATESCALGTDEVPLTIEAGTGTPVAPPAPMLVTVDDIVVTEDPGGDFVQFVGRQRNRAASPKPNG